MMKNIHAAYGSMDELSTKLEEIPQAPMYDWEALLEDHDTRITTVDAAGELCDAVPAFTAWTSKHYDPDDTIFHCTTLSTQTQRLNRQLRTYGRGLPHGYLA